MTANPLKSVSVQDTNKPKSVNTKHTRKRAKIGTVRFLARTLIVSVAVLSMLVGTLWYQRDSAADRAMQLATTVDHVFVENAVAAILKTNPKVTEEFARELVWAVIDLSMRYKVDVRVALGKLGVESAFNPKALSKTGARGLSQVMPRWWTDELRRAGIIDSNDDLYEMRPSVEAGMYVLAQYIKQAHGDYRRALAYYNAGPSGDAGDYPEQVARYAARF